MYCKHCQLFQRLHWVPHFLWRCCHWSIAQGMLNYYWTTVNTTCRTSCLIRDLMECVGTTPTFFTWYQYCANQNNKMHLESSFTLRPAQLYTTCNWGTDKNKQLTISQQKLALTAINILFALWNHQPPKNFKNQPCLLVSQVLKIFVKILELYLTKQSL